jgi:hypothetical protein
VFPNNCDAAFKSFPKSMPADTLLRYNYGAAAVKQWGKNTNVLNNRAGLPRPQKSKVLLVGPTRGIGDRMSTINKLARARGEPADNGEEHLKWDEDDVMLFFWGNSKASVERHAKKEREREQNINEWRKGVA